MYQYETITTRLWNLPVPIEEIVSMKLIFHTLTKTLVEKDTEECYIHTATIGDKTVPVMKVHLSQEESGKLTPGPVMRSFIMITKDGSRIEGKSEDLMVIPSGKDGVITYEL